MARYGVVSMASNVLQWLNYRADIFLLAAMRSEAEVGRYTVAVSLAEILMRGAAAICRPLFPRVARDALAGEVTARASRVAVLAMSAMAIALIGPGYLAHLYLGEAYAGMFAAFLWLLPGTIAYGLGYVLHFDLLARGTVGRLTIANGVSLCANIALNVVLIPRHGILGAAWSTSIAYALNLLLVGVMFRAMHGIPLRALWLPGRADAAELRARARGFAGGFGGR
jgi:O-antigen/teichoic acid export membrane protein